MTTNDVVRRASFSSDDLGSTNEASDIGDSDSQTTASFVRLETKLVKHSRILLVFVLAAATLLAALGTYFYAFHVENSIFESQCTFCHRLFVRCLVVWLFGFFLFFSHHRYIYIGIHTYTHTHTDWGDAHAIAQTSQTSASHISSTFQSLSTTMTSFARFAHENWPFVTVPDFDARVSQLLELSAADYISIVPLVPSNRRTQWESYAIQNQGWIQDRTTNSPGSSNSNVGIILPYIFKQSNENGTLRLPETRPADPYYAPIWQVAPYTNAAQLVNYNVFDSEYFQQLYNGMVEVKDVTLSEIININSTGVTDDTQWPQSYLAAPIYEQIGNQSNTVGVILAVIPWHIFFSSVLPRANAILVVIRNSCNQEFTYRLDGSDAVFLGVGDLHDSKYDMYELHADLAVGKTNSSYLCPYSMSVYPTEECYKQFHTYQPVVYIAAVVFIFVVTIAVFLLYDTFVEKRQMKVMTRAVRTNEIVSSLFPASVRERLMAEKQQLQGQDLLLREIHDMEANDSDGGEVGLVRKGRSSLTSNPIADLFPNATVLFGDIAGFTAWSSEREPEHVFVLLENVFNAFDKIGRCCVFLRLRLLLEPALCGCSLLN